MGLGVAQGQTFLLLGRKVPQGQIPGYVCACV